LNVWGGALISRLLEAVPEDSRPPHLALYNLALNAAVLSGTMLGPLIADLAGLREALFTAFAIRVGSGLVLARWG
jgi:predicted MFS family arabinose efflux permease